MGVFHLMGLGTSPGAVTAPLSYLGRRYRRWSTEDRLFFERSGEQAQREAGGKAGDAQAIVLFTTREVLSGELKCQPYIENVPGQTNGQSQPSGAMKDVLRGLLGQIWPPISGGRKARTVFWCEVDRRDIRNVYERVARVVTALGGVGRQGKEMWANLTGGNNVTNFALELAGTLSGNVARFYYVQGHDEKALRCVYHTAEEGYWVELPVMPLALGRLREAIIELLDIQPLSLEDLWSHLQNEYWDLSRGLDSAETLREQYLGSMWRQGLLRDEGRVYTVGPQWALIRPYQELLAQAREAGQTIEQLAENEHWIEHEELPLK